MHTGQWVIFLVKICEYLTLRAKNPKKISLVIKSLMNLLVILLLLFVAIVSYVRWFRRPLTAEPFEHFAIPRLIWQTYKTDKLPARALECQQSWKTQPGFTYHFLDDPHIKQFIRRELPHRVFKVFQSFPLGVMKADLWRYCVVYIEGGIYADIDAVAVRPITDWKIRPQHKCIIGLENDTHFCQWTFAAVPGHPIFETVIDLVVKECEKGIDMSNEHFVHQHTGPGIWTRAIHKVLGYPEAQKARHTYDLYRTQPEHRQRFDRLGIRLEDVSFFGSEMVSNLYGSQKFGDGYVSWTDERALLTQQTLQSQTVQSQTTTIHT
jgi:mannosyltransferase OCH1-like enzyme